jgi:outer membrane immunogenic protein
MKKFLMTGVALVAFGALNTATANEVVVNPYVGAYGGYGWNDVETSSGDVDIDGMDYGVYAGFKADKLLDETVNRLGTSLTGAIEVYYGGSSADDNLGALTVDKEYEYGVRFMPGLAIIDDINPVGYNPYAILGYKRANFEIDGVGDESFDGFELGIGTELVAYENVGIRLEYAHTWYGDEDIGGINVDNDEDTVRVGVGYHF